MYYLSAFETGGLRGFFGVISFLTATLRQPRTPALDDFLLFYRKIRAIFILIMGIKMKKLIITILVIIGFTACKFPSPSETSSVVESPKTDWVDFEVHKVYSTSIYSYPVYGAEGRYFMVDGWVYVQDTLLARMRPDGSEKELLPAEVNNFCLYSATYHDGWIYFIDERYMYLDTAPPPGTNEHLLRMRPDGTGLQECVKDVYRFEISGDWIFYQSGYSLYTVKIGEWNNPYVLYTNNGGTPETWNMGTWIIHDDYIFYSISETLGGDGQYNTKMYRMNWDGTNEILLMEDTSIVYDPRFVYDGFLYFSSYQPYQSGLGGDIIYRMDFDGKNIITIIQPDHYVLLRELKLRENWLYYGYSWRDDSKPYGENLNKSIRKVRPDGKDDREVDWHILDREENVDIWLDGDFVMWRTTSWADAGKVTRQRFFIAPVTRIEDAVEIFDGEGWESPMSYYIWNGNIYIFVKSWR
jgi:hypothetical protein